MAKSKQNSVILGLDVSSSSTGYAVLVNGRFYKTGRYHGKIIIKNNISLPERLVLFRDALSNILTDISPTAVVIEDVFSGRNIATMKLLARFNGVALEVSTRVVGSPPEIALAAAVRSKIGCGKGKEDAFKFICAKYKLDWDFDKMNDVSDALALALYGHLQKG